MGVEVSTQKSFYEVGLAEFAKGFYSKGKNLKPLSAENMIIKGRKDAQQKVVQVARDICREAESSE